MTRWLNEKAHKKSIKDDIIHLRWLHPYLHRKTLPEIDKNLIEEIANKKESVGVTQTTVNRMLEVIRAILRKAVYEWEWLDKMPHIRMRHVENRRVRWLTIEEANRLLSELSFHLKSMAAFTLATGLRASNVLKLQWSQVDLDKKHAFINSDESKTKKAIAVPLNSDAIRILKEQERCSDYVFTYKGSPIKQCNTKAWRKALERAKIKDFRWHDLRHTWASWHIQNGTTLQELQILGGWSSFEMVLRYAHLSSDHLQAAANKIVGAKLVQQSSEIVEKWRARRDSNPRPPGSKPQRR